MVKQFCDRCGRLTKNSAAFLLPSNKEESTCFVNGTWFGKDAIVLCDWCIDDFEKFRVEHDHFNLFLESDSDWARQKEGE